VSEIRAAFALFDKDGDGTITTEELATAMRKMGHTPTATELQEMIAEADADGNGTIDFKEFVALMTKSLKEEEVYVNPEVVSAFNVFDKDGDGFISRNELRRVMDLFYDEPKDDLMNSIMREADLDGDDAISFSGWHANGY
ncbi:hypothetical protein CAPTEDRAFT_97188, partial [Capitella teleta]